MDVKSRTGEEADLMALLRQQESLRQIIESISSELELRPLLTRIVRHACELLDADNGTIGLVDPLRNIIRTEAAYRMPVDELGAEISPGEGLFGHVYRTNLPVVLSHYAEIEHPTQLGMLEMTVVGAPIMWRGRLIGVFGLGSPPPRKFTAQDVEMLSLFANHAAIAIENARLFAGTQTALEEMQLLYETGRRISAASDTDAVVTAYLEQVAMRGKYDCTIALYETNRAGQKIGVQVQGWWKRGEGMVLQRLRHPYTQDALDPLLDAGQTVTIADVHTDPRVSAELRVIQRDSRRPSLAFVPLIVRSERIGLVVLTASEVHSWPIEELRSYEVTAAQLASALESRRQQILVYERGQELAILEERHRLARDLHDSVTQMVFSITLLAQSVAPAWKRDPVEGERRVQRLLDLSRAALTEMRSLLADLQPPEAPWHTSTVSSRASGGAERSLSQSIVDYAAAIAPEEIHLTLSDTDYIPQPADVEETLYRIAQEALNNIVKHARSRQVKIMLITNQSATTMIVQDDGIGMDLFPLPKLRAESGAGGGMGMRTMRERAEALGGSVEFSSPPTGGTLLEVTIPELETGH